MQKIILPELEELRKQTDFVITNNEILGNKELEKYLRKLEQIRYDIFNKIDINNKESEEQKINYINDSYKAYLKQDVLKIHIPEVLPKFKNINNYAYKHIMLSTAECVKEYRGLFNTNLTFVLIIVHERQANMDIDNKYVKPIIDALVLEKIIQDDNINNMFYQVIGKKDTIKPYTEVFVMDGKYMESWVKKVQNLF